jgi:hypothetical protein
MSERNSQLVPLLESFTSSQLRELDLLLAPPGAHATKGKGREGFIRAITKRYEGNKLALHALRLEAISPYKHVFIFTFGALKNDFDVKGLRNRLEKGFPDLFDKPTLLDPQLDELQAEVCVFDRENERLLVKYVHLVETWKWEWTSDRTKRIEKYERRHPVVITLRPKERLMTVSFPGYTQGAIAPGKQRTAYVDIARKACEGLASASEIQAGSFPLKQTIELILQKEAGSVIDVRRDLKPEQGKMMFDSGERKASLSTYVADMFRREGIDVTEAEIRKMFGSTEAADILLWWKKREVLTRVAFNDYAAELLFIWRETSADASRIEDVLSTLIEYQKFIDRNQLAQALEYVDQSTTGTKLRSSALAQQFNLSANEALDILYRGVQRGVLEMLFRVKTDAELVEFSNDWRKELSEFPRSVTDDKGDVIDLTENANIEVAFERTPA